jgi:hypothetical protein
MISPLKTRPKYAFGGIEFFAAPGPYSVVPDRDSPPPNILTEVYPTVVAGSHGRTLGSAGQGGRREMDWMVVGVVSGLWGGNGKKENGFALGFFTNPKAQ